MTVSNTQRRIAYAGDGVTRVFPVPFRFLAASDLVVISSTATGVETALAVNSGFSASGAGDMSGGSVTLTVAPAAGSRLTIKRQTARQQPIDFTAFGSFPAETNETGLDRGILISQEDGDELLRALRVPESDAAIGQLTMPTVPNRAGRVLAFDSNGRPSAGPSVDALNNLIAIAFTPGLTQAGDNVSFLAAGTGAVVRSVQDKGRERLGLMDFIPAALRAAVRAGTNTDVLTSYIALAVAACPNGGTIYVEPGVYRGTWEIPAGKAITVEGAGYASCLEATAAGDRIFSVRGIDNRDGYRMLRWMRIDGRNLANVYGIAALDDAPLLYFRGEHLHITRCTNGCEWKNVQESSLSDTLFYYNTLGLVVDNSPTDTGGTALALTRVRFQYNYAGGLILKSSAPFPTGQWQMDAVLFQGNGIFGYALFLASGGGVIDGININGLYAEANGVFSSPEDTYSWRGETIPRCGGYIEGAIVTIDGSQIGESYANMTSFVLRSGAVLCMRDSTLGGGTRLHIDADNTSRVNMTGRNIITGSINEVFDWSGFGYVGGGGGMMTGIPVRTIAALPVNRFAANGNNADCPNTSDLSAGIASTTVYDDDLGFCRQLVFNAGAGSTGGNRAVFGSINENIAAGDTIAIGVEVKATGDIDLAFIASGASALTTVGVYSFKAGQVRKIWIYGTAPADIAGGYALFVYPTGASAGRTVRLAAMTAVRVPNGQPADMVSEAIRRGLYSNGQEPIAAPAPPTGGTWPRGKRIINSAPAVGAARAWVKVTTGANNVVGTDWISEGNL